MINPDHTKRIEELEELRKLLLMDLRHLNRLEEKIGSNRHLNEMLDKFLDQLNDIDSELKILKDKFSEK